LKSFILKNKKIVANAVFLVLVFAFTMHYVFHGTEGDISTLWEKVQMADVWWLLLAVAFIVLFVAGESYIIHYMLRTLSIHTRKFTCFLYSCVGFFFSCITPASSGGQPAQLYYMKKNKISLPVATVVLMIVTVTFKMVLVVVGLWLLIFDRTFISKYLSGILPVFYLGTLLNVICVISMLVLIFDSKLAKRIVVTLVRLLEKSHLMKHKEGRVERYEASMDTYSSTAKYLKGHIPVIVNVFLVTLLQRFAYFFVTYCIYKSFHLKGTSMYDVVMLQAVISVCVEMLPLPGGMGISEALFNAIYLPVFGGAFLLPGMVLSRSLSFYTELFLCAIFTIFAHIYIGRFTKKEAEQSAKESSDFKQMI
jgi:uncharacterized protein (TIRG00374 family)